MARPSTIHDREQTMGRPRNVRHVRPKRAAAGVYEDSSFVLNPNHIYDADDELVRAHPDLFIPIEPSKTRPEVEAATAAPGEVRGA